MSLQNYWKGIGGSKPTLIRSLLKAREGDEKQIGVKNNIKYKVILYDTNDGRKFYAITVGALQILRYVVYDGVLRLNSLHKTLDFQTKLFWL